MRQTPRVWTVVQTRIRTTVQRISVESRRERLRMKCDKYMGMDVHQAMTVVAVLDAEGKVILETMVPTESAAIIRLVQSLSAPLHVTFEETTQAEWLWNVLRPFAAEVVVFDPRRNKVLREG